MKVCDCVKNSIWYDPRVRKQISEYKRNNIDVVAVGCICPRYSKEDVDKIECPVLLAKIPTDYYQRGLSVFKKAYRDLKTNYGMYKLIKSCGADIVHANDLNALIPAYFAAKRSRMKIVYDSHEIFIENPWIAKRKWLHSLLFHIERYLIRRVDLLVNVSYAAGEYMGNLYPVKSRIVVTNCISETTVSKIKIQSKNKGFEVLNHGQFYGGRGYDVMVDSSPLISDLQDVKLVLRGFGPMEESLRDKVHQNHFNNVVFAAPVKTNELIPFASSSHVGVAITQKICLNFELSISNKIFEYAAAGLPVIMSDIPEHRYLNNKYHFGIVLDEDTPVCLAAAIRELFLNHELYSQLSENARKFSADVTWEREFKKLLDFEFKLIA